jgi:hypothetical protein
MDKNRNDIFFFEKSRDFPHIKSIQKALQYQTSGTTTGQAQTANEPSYQFISRIEMV